MTRDEEAAHGIERPEHFEHADVNPNGVIVFLVSLLVGVGLSLVVVWLVYGAFSRSNLAIEPFPVPKPEQAPPEPRIQSAPQLEIWQVRQHEDAVLRTYGWIDHGSGVAHIPIDRAMDLLAQRGLPAETGGAPAATVPDTGPASGGPQTGSSQPRGAAPPGGFAPSRPLPLMPVQIPQIPPQPGSVGPRTGQRAGGVAGGPVPEKKTREERPTAPNN